MREVPITMNHIKAGIHLYHQQPYYAVTAALLDEGYVSRIVFETKGVCASDGIFIDDKRYGITSTLASWLFAYQQRRGNVMPINILLTDGEYPVAALGLYSPDNEDLREWHRRKHGDDRGEYDESWS